MNKKVVSFFLLLGFLSFACSFEVGNYRFGPIDNQPAVIEQEPGVPSESDQAVKPWNDEDGQAIVGDENTPRFSKWVGDYIKERGGSVVDNGSWWQGELGGLTISWAEWGVENLKLGTVDGLYFGKSLFVAMRDFAAWTESSDVEHFECVGTYIPSYSSAMSSYDVSNSTILQFDGTGARAFVVEMAASWDKVRKDLKGCPKP